MNSDFKAACLRLLKIIYPNRCKRCGEVIELDEAFCEDCLNTDRIKLPICTHCGFSLDDCCCRKKKNEFQMISAPYYFKDNITKAIHRFKYDMPFLSKQMAADMYETVKREYADIQFDCITYVPMTKRDIRKRGYNQAFLLAKELADLSSVACMDLLVKTQQTQKQKMQNARQRKVNVFGAFDVINREFVNGKTILLVDDVKTTGSTLNECSKMLKLYGAKSVYAAVFCVVKNH